MIKEQYISKISEKVNIALMNTYEAMVSICELFDGYTSEDIQLDLIEKNSNTSLTTGIQMHDMCADYLKCEG